MVHVDETRWFLAQLKPNSAQIANRNLQRQGFETFLPRERTTHTQRGRFISRLSPLFPGYIFVSVDPRQGLWRAIRSTQGVTRLVSFGAEPAVVPPTLVAQLQSHCGPDGEMLPPDEFRTGDQVRLAIGPFSGFLAEIDRIEPERRVWVLMDIIGRQTRVAVRPDQLRRA